MSDLLQLLLALAVLISASKLAGLLSTRLGQPAVLGELLIGVLLGPSALDLLRMPAFSSPHLEATIMQLAELGVIFLMFIAGLEIEFDELRRAGSVAVVAGTLGVVAPLLMGGATSLAFGYPLEAALFIGILMTATSVSISAQTLIELGKLRTHVGMVLLGAAVFDDVLGIVVLSLFLALAGGSGGGVGAIALTVVRMALFLGLSALAAGRLFPWIIKRVARWPISQPVVSTAIVGALLMAWSSEYVGAVAAITGAFIAGVACARSAQRAEISRGIQGLAYGFLVPIFFLSIGLRTDVRLIQSHVLAFATAICAVAVISKIIGCGLGARLTGVSGREALQIGVGMISRGEVGLIVASVGIGAGIIHQEVFAVTVLMVLFTTLITPVLLRGVLRDPAASPDDARGGDAGDQQLTLAE
jgi:Kef-type K+ transport system membrane component KefB